MTAPTTAPGLVDTDELKAFKKDLIRKSLKGALLRGAVGTKIESLTFVDSDNKIKLRDFTKAPYSLVPVGALTEDGITEGRTMDVSKITSWGVSAAQRTDVKSDTVSLKATRQETNALTLAESLGFEVSELNDMIDPETGELQVLKPGVTTLKRGLYLALSQDVYPKTGGRIWIGTLLPEGEVATVGDIVDANADNARGAEVTVESRVNDDYGTDVVWLFGGPGWNDALTDMGFTKPTSAPTAG